MRINRPDRRTGFFFVTDTTTTTTTNTPTYSSDIISLGEANMRDSEKKRHPCNLHCQNDFMEAVYEYEDKKNTWDGK